MNDIERSELSRRVDDMGDDIREVRKDLKEHRDNSSKELGSVNEKIDDLKTQLSKEIGGVVTMLSEREAKQVDKEEKERKAELERIRTRKANRAKLFITFAGLAIAGGTLLVTAIQLYSGVSH
jgi:hypothetical protein